MPFTSTSTSFQVHTGSRSIDVTVEGEAVFVNGRAVAVSFEPVAGHSFLLQVDGYVVPATIEPVPDGRVRVTVRGQSFVLRVRDETDLLRERFGMTETTTAGAREVRAPMPGLVRSVSVGPGDAVRKGTRLLVLEAMKMENEIRSDVVGTVRAIHVETGEAVLKDALLIELDP